MEEKNKGSNLFIIILTVIITVIVTLGIVYFAFLRKPEEPTNNGGNNTSETLTDDVIIALAKIYIDRANSMIDYYSVHFGDGEDCLDSDNLVCFYKTKNKFESDVYQLFSKKLTINDILDTSGELNGFTHYGIKDNKIYIQPICNMSGLSPKYNDFTVVSKTDQMINVKYKIYEDYDPYSFYDKSDGVPEDQLKKEYQEYLNTIEWSNIELVKENDEWKINKATLLNICGGEFTVG